MRLPVAAYVTLPMPPGADLRRVPNTSNEFELDMPTMKFLDVEVRPRVFANVATTPKAVHITAQRCRIDGSDFIEQFKLNDLFTLALDVQFTWDGRSITSDSTIRVNVERPGPFALMPTPLVETTGNEVMRLSLNLIQAEFVKALGKDFERWSRDAAYREMRAQMA